MLITTIGSASGCSTSLRDSAGVYIQSSKNILLDCGEATNKYFLNRDVNELDVICITHAHVDHFIGLPMLLFHNLTIRGRTKPLKIIAPRSVEIYMHAFHHFYPVQGIFDYSFDYYDMRNSDRIWNFGDVYIAPTEVEHSTHECYGYYVCDLFEDKLILYTGDTKIFDKIITLCEDCDMIIADGTWASDYMGPAYGHSWAKDVIYTVNKSNCDKVVLTHLSQRYHSEAGYRIYSNDVIEAFKDCKNLKRVYIAYDGLEIML